MSLADPDWLGVHPSLLCDLTQSWSACGGGIGTYIRRKRRHILERTVHRHLLIVPGERDSIIEEDRAIICHIASPRVPKRADYRLLLRSKAVRALLDRFRPDLIECQDAYNLPWTAIAHRRNHPAAALVGAYCTDLPAAYVQRPLSGLIGQRLAAIAGRAAEHYCGQLYRRFDAVYAMSEHGGGARLRMLGISRLSLVPRGVDLDGFHPGLRDDRLRRSIGLGGRQPLLVYAGRLDREKGVPLLIEAFRLLPPAMNARLLLLGEGPLRRSIRDQARDGRILAPGYIADRGELARWLASADLYVSGMADETFGTSILEAQASGLPVVGIRSGAMIDRVPPGLGLLGPPGDAAAFAGNVAAALSGDLRSVGARARRHALAFGWEASLTLLFQQVYRSALARSAERRAQLDRGLPATAARL